MQTHKLSNGLTLTIQRDPSIPLVTTDMWVRVGSGDEPAHIAGISHFLEHMLFKGTPNLPVGEYDRRVEEAGGYLNAATSMDYTHYYVTLPSERFPEVFPLFADVMKNSSLVQEEVDSERLVILEEISRKLDSPFGYLFDETIPALFAEGPYKHPVIGSRDTVNAITREQLLEHYERFYTPENMFLSIVGDVDPDAVIAEAEKHFGDLNRPLRPWRDSAPPTRYVAPFDRKLEQSWKEAYFIVAFPGPGIGTMAEEAAAAAADELLTGGRTARLVNSLQEKKALVSSIGTYFMSNRHPAPLMIYGTCKPENLEAVRAAILAELELLIDKGMTDQELNRVKRQALNGHLFSMETNAGRASTFGYSNTILGDLSMYQAYPTAIRRITRRDVQEYIKAHLIPGTESFHVTLGGKAGSAAAAP